jgi:hypothetical protein
MQPPVAPCPPIHRRPADRPRRPADRRTEKYGILRAIMQIVEEIPDSLAAEVDAALRWLNAEQGCDFHVTGIVDPEIAERAGGAPHDLTLILCEDDRCVREQLRVERQGDRFAISRTAVDRTDPPAEIDPRPGARAGWIEAALARHAFVVLVFYRGFW